MCIFIYLHIYIFLHIYVHIYISISLQVLLYDWGKASDSMMQRRLRCIDRAPHWGILFPVTIFYPWNSGQFSLVWCFLLVEGNKMLPFAMDCTSYLGDTFYFLGPSWAKPSNSEKKKEWTLGPIKTRGPTLGWCRKSTWGEHKFQKRLVQVEKRDNFRD